MPVSQEETGRVHSCQKVSLNFCAHEVALLAVSNIYVTICSLVIDQKFLHLN